MQVFHEYPLCIDRQNFLHGDRKLWSELFPAMPNYVPTYQQCIKLGFAPSVIHDIAVARHGRITFAVEIIHQHPPTEKAVRFMNQRLTYQVFSIDADLALALTEWRGWDAEEIKPLNKAAHQIRRMREQAIHAEWAALAAELARERELAHPQK